MRARLCLLAILGLSAILLVGCGAKSKIDDVVKGFFSEINRSNFETAKAKYLSTKLINTLNAPGVPAGTLEKSWKDVVGHIKSIEVAAIEAKGESAKATALLTMPWGTVWHGNVDLIKEGGQEWKISDMGDFKKLGRENVRQALRKCRFKDEAGASADFAAAFAESPKDAMILTDWGTCYAGLGSLTAAEQRLKQAIEMYPDIVWTPYVILAQVYSKQGRLKEAEDALQKAIKNNPEDAAAHNSLAWLYAENNRKLDRAIELAQKALTLSPDDPNILDTLGWAYYKKSDRAEAVRFLARAKAKAPYNQQIQAHYKEASETAAVHVSRAYSLIRSGRYDEAIAAAGAALRQEPNNQQAQQARQLAQNQAVAAHLQRAEQLFRAQRYDEAVRECDAALRYDPQNRQALTLKNRILETKKVLGY